MLEVLAFVQDLQLLNLGESKEAPVQFALCLAAPWSGNYITSMFHRSTKYPRQ